MEQSLLLFREVCPVCHSPGSSEFLKCKDYTVSNEWFTIVCCDSCGFKFTNPVPAPEVIGKYYKSEEYISHSDTKKGLISRLYHLVRNFTLKSKLQLIGGRSEGMRLLDYGCGTGSFLEVCKNAGWLVTGMEPDEDAAKLASRSGAIYPDLQTLKLRDQKYDVITLWHVLEHVSDLAETLSFFTEVLLPGGRLIIAVPNYRSYDAVSYGAHWAAYDVPRHLYHFDQTTLGTLLKSYGFVLDKVRPMLFDSFYVSLLSEKYLRGKSSYLRAFMTGLRSNIKASRTGEYSSLIYIFTK